MEAHIDKHDLRALVQAVNTHPDCIGMVVWTREDIEQVCSDHNMSADEAMSVVDMEDWECRACETGWDAINDDLRRSQS